MRALLALFLTTSLAAPAGAVELAEAEEREFEALTRLDLGARVGYGRRLDDPPLFYADDRNGLLLGAELTVFLARRLAVGLAYEHLGLGSEESGLTPTGTFEIDRELDTLWLDVRLYPWLIDRFGVYLGLAAGPSWQSAELTGSVWPRHDPGAWITFRCEGADSPGFALHGEIGADIALGGGLRAIVAPGFDGYRLSDEPMDDCVPGAGSSFVFGLRGALVYAMDLR